MQIPIHLASPPCAPKQCGMLPPEKCESWKIPKIQKGKNQSIPSRKNSGIWMGKEFKFPKNLKAQLRYVSSVSTPTQSPFRNYGHSFPNQANF